MNALFKNLRGFTKQSIISEINNPLSVVTIRKKSYDPKFKWLRREKVLPIELPDYSEKFSKEKLRTRMKTLGLMPPRYWKERPMTVTTLHEIIDCYLPPEADGKASLLTKEGVGSVVTSLKKKRENSSALKKIKSYDSNFDVKIFPQEAHDIYVKAHTILMKNDPEELSNYVTERANMEMSSGLKFKTLRWKFIESLEPPVVTQIRTAPVVTETNLFAQITVRFHTKQCLAIYDRFGRLFYGNETVPKDVLEYVVFEKHIVNEYGTWRMHAKVIPDWKPSSAPSGRTYRVDSLYADEEEDEEADIVEEQHERLPQQNTVEIYDKNPETQPHA